MDVNALQEAIEAKDARAAIRSIDQRFADQDAAIEAVMEVLQEGVEILPSASEIEAQLGTVTDEARRLAQPFRDLLESYAALCDERARRCRCHGAELDRIGKAMREKSAAWNE